jgi:hypothetical protein
MRLTEEEIEKVKSIQAEISKLGQQLHDLAGMSDGIREGAHSVAEAAFLLRAAEQTLDLVVRYEPDRLDDLH